MSRLIPELTAEQKAAVIARARLLLTASHKGGPVPFRHQGRTVRGIDCIGVLAWSFGEFFAIADRTDYGRLPAQRKLSESMRLHFGDPLRRPTLADVQPGDVLTMEWGAEPGHVALVTDHPHGVGVIHAWLAGGFVIEHRLDDKGFGHVLEVFRP